MAVLALACALLPLGGCPSRNHGFAGMSAMALPQAPLAWTVHAAQVTHRLETSTLESKEAAPGNQFIVLDVSVRNHAADPQVLPEGRLIAMNESQLRTFDTPVTLLSDEYLSLQVLSPAQSMRGKIAYEVPEHLSGVLYWTPGNGSRRILLNVATPARPQLTLANADRAPEPDVDATRVGPADANLAAAPERSTRRDDRGRMPQTDNAVARATPPPTVQPPSAITATAAVDASPTHALVSAPVQAPARVSAPVQAAAREVAVIAVPQTPVAAPLSVAPSRAVAVQPLVDGEQARRLACQGLVTRDDPSEAARSLGLFAGSCRDYALPAHWRPQPTRRSLLARASDLIARVVVHPRVVRVPACAASASPADMLVCRDAGLSALDQQLAQSFARARDHVDDPAALQRDQVGWREQVRNTCQTVGCLESAYGRRIAQINALAPARSQSMRSQ
ncbi:MAG: hypothetical protein JWL98_1734 [Xanthomonadaceae bacterium]|nr:hypothetical protein [Xanthomonadaceae bacterium]